MKGNRRVGNRKTIQRNGMMSRFGTIKKRNVKRTVSREQETPRERSPRERHAKRKIWSRDRLKKMVPSEQNVGAIRAGRQEKEVSRRKAGQGEER